jgi:hypothetical protein
MPRLINDDLASTGRPHLRNETPSGFLNLRALNVLLIEGSHFGFQIVAHEIDFLGAFRFPTLQLQREDIQARMRLLLLYKMNYEVKGASMRSWEMIL